VQEREKLARDFHVYPKNVPSATDGGQAERKKMDLKVSGLP